MEHQILDFANPIRLFRKSCDMV